MKRYSQSAILVLNLCAVEESYLFIAVVKNVKLYLTSHQYRKGVDGK